MTTQGYRHGTMCNGPKCWVRLAHQYQIQILTMATFDIHTCKKEILQIEKVEKDVMTLKNGLASRPEESHLKYFVICKNMFFMI